MTNNNDASHRSIGDRLAPFALATLAHGTLHVPGAGLTHLQFRRFAGCPICNLHVQSFARSHPRIEEAGVRTIALFHSTEAQMRPHQGALPFPTVADPERRWYRHFGVEQSLLAVMHPKAMWTALRGLGASSNPLVGASEPNGLPADFLLNAQGVVVQAHYGKHADDQWSVDVLLALARTSR